MELDRLKTLLGNVRANIALSETDAKELAELRYQTTSHVANENNLYVNFSDMQLIDHYIPFRKFDANDKQESSNRDIVKAWQIEFDVSKFLKIAPRINTAQVLSTRTTSFNVSKETKIISITNANKRINQIKIVAEYPDLFKTLALVINKATALDFLAPPRSLLKYSINIEIEGHIETKTLPKIMMNAPTEFIESYIQVATVVAYLASNNPKSAFYQDKRPKFVVDGIEKHGIHNFIKNITEFAKNNNNLRNIADNYKRKLDTQMDAIVPENSEEAKYLNGIIDMLVGKSSYGIFK